jgi:hypothetical protein
MTKDSLQPGRLGDPVTAVAVTDGNPTGRANHPISAMIGHPAIGERGSVPTGSYR